MARFLDPLIVEEISDSIFQLKADFRYQSDLVEEIILSPCGFFTDYASVPRWTPIIYSMLGDTAHAPAVTHDTLYYFGKTTREMADNIFLEAMGVIGISYFKRHLMWLGVRSGGWVAWNAHRAAHDGLPTKFPVPPVITPKA